MTTTLTPTRAGFTQMLAAAQHSRSIAAEGEYADLLEDQTIDLLGHKIKVPGLDPVLGNPKIIDLLASLVTGERTCDATLWMNLTRMVQQSPSWGISLAARGYEMPDALDALRNFDAQVAS